MAEFKSAAEKKKWDSLQHQAGHSLHQIAQGKATSADFQRVSNTLSGLNKLAQQVFDEAVSAAEVQAKKFQAQYDTALEKLKADEKDQDLTAYEQALNKVLLERNPDLIQAIHEAITLELFQQSEDLEKSIGGKFDSIKDLLPPKDLPTVDDTLAAGDLLVEKLSSLDDSKWERRSGGLLDKIGSLFRDTLQDIADQVMRSRQQGSAPESHRPRLAGPSRALKDNVIDMEDVGAPPQLQKANQLVADDPMVELQKLMQLTGPAPAMTSMSSGALPKNTAEPTIQMSPKTEATISQAAEDQTSLYTELINFLKNPAQAMANSGGSGFGGAGGGSGQDKEESEDEKADTWWRSFRNWMGDKYDKAKDWSKDNKGWLSSLGTLLTTMLLDPQLFEQIGSLIGKYLSWDSVKDAALGAWSYLKDKGTSVVDWVMDKLHIKDAANYVEDKYKKTKEAVSNAKDTVVKGASSALNKVENFFGGGDQTQNTTNNTTLNKNGSSTTKAGTSPAKAAAPSAAGSAPALAVPPSAAGLSSTTVQSPTLNGGSNRSSVINNTTNANGPTTVAADGKPMSVTPGITAQAPGTAPLDGGGQAAQSGLPSKGSPQISMSSFKFHSSVDDSLPMMNTTFFTG